MRICPICASTYDDSVDFCFKDGAPLDAMSEDGAPRALATIGVTSTGSMEPLDETLPPNAISLSNMRAVDPDESIDQLPRDLDGHPDADVSVMGHGLRALGPADPDATSEIVDPFGSPEAYAFRDRTTALAEDPDSTRDDHHELKPVEDPDEVGAADLPADASLPPDWARPDFVADEVADTVREPKADAAPKSGKKPGKRSGKKSSGIEVAEPADSKEAAAAEPEEDESSAAGKKSSPAGSTKAPSEEDAASSKDASVKATPPVASAKSAPAADTNAERRGVGMVSARLDPEESTGGGKGPMYVAIAAAVLLIGLLGWVLFGRGGSDVPEPTPIAARTPAPRATATPPPTPEPTAVAQGEAESDPEPQDGGDQPDSGQQDGGSLAAPDDGAAEGDPAGAQSSNQEPTPQPTPRATPTPSASDEQATARAQAAEQARREQREKERLERQRLERERREQAAASATPLPKPEPPFQAATPTPEPEPTAAAPTTGTAAITAIPADAVITVDGRRHGSSPQNLELPAGRHEVRIGKDGFAAETRIINVVAGEKASLAVTLEALAPVARTGTLNVITPTPANLSVDGVARGRTPTSVSLSEGSHRFTLQVEGQAPFTTTIDVKFDADGKATRFIPLQ